MPSVTAGFKEKPMPENETITLPVWTCNRCGHRWIGKSQEPPRVCVSRSCHSPYWNRERKHPKKEEEK